jgi:hypothetical protein
MKKGERRVGNLEPDLLQSNNISGLAVFGFEDFTIRA